MEMEMEVDQTLTLDTDSETDDSVIELEVETCSLCRAEFFSGQELTHHLALDHFQHGLLQELLALGWEDGDRTCPQCGDDPREDVLLHWATQHHRAEALLRKCYQGGRVSLYRDKISCNQHLARRGPRVDMFPNSLLVKSIYQAEQEQQALKDEEEDVIILDESSDDEIQIVEVERETVPPKRGIKHIKQEISREILSVTQKSSNNNHSLVPIKHNNGQGVTEDVDDQNMPKDSEENILVETILERITPAETCNSNLLSKTTDSKMSGNNPGELALTTKDAIKRERRDSKLSGDGGVRSGTVCKICSRQFSSRRDFTDHLAAQHFRAALEQEIVRNGELSQASCPSCSLFKSKDLTKLIIHYGARCKPFPVNKMYSTWLSGSSLGLSNDICVFCGARAHSPNDLAFHLRDKHVAEVREKMGFNFFFKFRQVRPEWSLSFKVDLKVQRAEGSVVEFSCPSCGKTEEDLDKLCLHFMRQHETLFIEIYQKFSSQSGDPVRCDLCPELTSSPLHYLQHLTSQHLFESLLSECGCSPDQKFACSSCAFVETSREATVDHYASKHLERLDFFFTEFLATLMEVGKITVSNHNMTSDTPSLHDYGR